MAVRESGHVTAERLVDLAADLVMVVLNSLLFKMAKHLPGSELADRGTDFP